MSGFTGFALATVFCVAMMFLGDRQQQAQIDDLRARIEALEKK